ncbi:MAG: hypothetical protein RL654_1440 [Pseudomonadota bacterium]
MSTRQHVARWALALWLASGSALAAPALEVLGRDFTFPNRIEGLPERLSDVQGLQINRFTTRDGVKLAYWEIGSGRPVIFIPGWSAHGAEYINLLHLLGKHYRVLVLDPRNQGLSQQVDHGVRISRFAADLQEFTEHLGLKSADYVGWSMGAAVLWSRIDLFGTQGMRRLVFVDEPVSIYAHSDWSEAQRRQAGAMTTSVEHMQAVFTAGAAPDPKIIDTKVLERAMANDAPAYVNSQAFAAEFVRTDPNFAAQVLFDHATNDWQDVLRHKIDVPTAIFSGEYSNNLPSQRWMASVIPGASLQVYSQAEQGDHFLMFKNPMRFVRDLRAFLDR